MKARLFKVGYFITIVSAGFAEFLILKILFPDLDKNRPTPIQFYIGFFIFAIQFGLMLLFFIYTYIKVSRKLLGRDFVRENLVAGTTGLAMTRGLENMIQRWINS